MKPYVNGCITSGSYFTYKGVHYGQYTIVLFTEDFYKKVGEYVDPTKTRSLVIKNGFKYPYFRGFSHTSIKNDKTLMYFSNGYARTFMYHYVDMDPDRDIEKIITPVYYYTPKELVKKRLNDGSWFRYIWFKTLIYALCLLISPLFQQWYLVWTVGLYIYIRLCYIELSKGELIYAW